MTEIQLEWNYGGNDVKIAGTFNNWQPNNMTKIDNKWIYKIKIQADIYIYKFIVDGTWCVNDNMEKMTDENGNVNNIINMKKNKELLKKLPNVFLYCSDKGYYGENNDNIIGNIKIYLPIYESKLLNNITLFNIVDIMVYTSGPFSQEYDVVCPPGYCNWIPRTSNYDYNLITIIYIDIYGNLYIGRVADKLSPRRQATLHLSRGDTTITYNEFFEYIYINPFLDGPVLKEKLFMYNSSQYKSAPLKIKLSQEEINNKQLEIFNEIKKDVSNDIFNLTIEMHKNNSSIINNLGNYYREQKKYDNMKKYYLLAIEKDDSNAMNNLGTYCGEKKDYDNMRKYYLMAIDKCNITSMYNLGLYYQQQKDYDNMRKYYLMAIDKGCSRAMFSLGLYYQEQKDYDNMKKYYSMLIEKGDSDAMFNLGNYYKEQKDYENMKKYYLMAIEKDNSSAMNNLGNYYKNQKDYDNMKKYYLMAIEKGNTIAKNNLDVYYKEQKDYENKRLEEKLKEDKVKAYDEIYNLVMNKLENNIDFKLFYKYITDDIMNKLTIHSKNLYTDSTIKLEENIVYYKKKLIEYAKLNATGIKDPSYLNIIEEDERQKERDIQEEKDILEERARQKEIERGKQEEIERIVAKYKNLEEERYRQEERDRYEDEKRRYEEQNAYKNTAWYQLGYPSEQAYTNVVFGRNKRR